MTVSEEWIGKLKEFEGYSSKAYRCPAGVLTIGFGHTGKDVFEGQVIDPAGAEALLREDLRVFENGVNSLFSKTRIGQHQFDALVDFAYNCGLGNLRKSTLAKRVIGNSDNHEGIKEAFMMWVNGGGKKLPGLVKRREAEAEWYKKDVIK